ncbi:MAG: Dabb family protein, partial [Bacillota bacterium]|nr:Dabb family protein [Bacillota bacterium]
MVKHIVMWKLKDSAHGNSKQKNAQLIKSML